jgi:predicted lipase
MRPTSLAEAVTCLRYIETAYRQNERPLMVESFGTLFIAISGTDSPTDVLSDLQVHRVSFRYGGHVHGGFEDVYRRVAHQVLARAANATDIVVCGHSMGGAVANLLALAIAHEFPQAVLRVYTFGAPGCGDGTFKRLYKRMVPRSLRVINDHDPIPLACNWFYHHVPAKLHLGGDGRRLKRLKSFWLRLLYWVGWFRDRRDHYVSSYEHVVRLARTRNVDIG